jgi:hypothetical protein
MFSIQIANATEGDKEIAKYFVPVRKKYVFRYGRRPFLAGRLVILITTVSP